MPIFLMNILINYILFDRAWSFSLREIKYEIIFRKEHIFFSEFKLLTSYSVFLTCYIKQ